MNVYLNSIQGIPDSIEAMFFSKRSWNMDKHHEIRNVCKNVLDTNGFMKQGLDREDKDEKYYEQFNKWLDTVCKMTIPHITVGKFIDFSFIVTGLHRAGQDDWDSHAERFNNRIIRNSTRLAEFTTEKSDYYKDRILTTDEVMDILCINRPNEIELNGNVYVKTTNGYIMKEFEYNKDVKRGLYMLSIPSNFIFKVNLTEFSHVYKERNENGTAHPEVKLCAEMCLAAVQNIFPQFNRELMMSIKN